MAKSKQKKIERLEGVAVGAGFLLRKLKAEYGPHFGEGMRMQVDDCIRDCRQIEAAMRERKEREMVNESAD